MSRVQDYLQIFQKKLILVTWIGSNFVADFGIRIADILAVLVSEHTSIQFYPIQLKIG